MPTVGCVEISFAGRTWRVAEQAFEANSTRLGRTVRFDGGLPQLEVTRTLDLLKDSPPDSVKVEAILPGVARLVELGHPLEEASIEVSYYSGGNYEDREIITQGGAVDPEYTPDPETVRFSVDQDPAQDVAVYPPEKAKVNQDTCSTWTTSYAPSTRDEDKRYPFVFGWPGVLRKFGNLIYVPGSPAPVVYDAVGAGFIYILPTYEWSSANPRTGRYRVWAFNDDASVSDYVDAAAFAWRPSPGLPGDDLGQRITVARLSNLAGRGQAVYNYYAGARNTAVYLAWHDDTVADGKGQGGGRDQYGDPLGNAGSLIRHALQQSTRPVDWARTDVAVEGLRGWEIGGYWTDSISPWDYVRDNVLPILPVSTTYTPDGIALVRWAWWDTTPIRHLEVGRNCSWVSGPVQQNVQDQLSQITVRYAKRADTGVYLESRVLQRDLPAAARTNSSLSLARSRSGRSETIETDSVWSEHTAGLILHSRAALDAVSPRSIVVDTDPAWRFDVGSSVELTVSGLSLARKRAIIVRVRRSGSVQRLTLRLAERGPLW